jgi:hypothetical protein
MTYMTLLYIVAVCLQVWLSASSFAAEFTREPPFSNSQSLESLDLCFGNLLEVLRSLFPIFPIMPSADFCHFHILRLVTVFGKPLMLEHEAFSLAQPMDALL